jgi:hypothetical protein
MDVRATLEELRESLGVDEVALWCWSSDVLETAWVVAEDGRLRVTDRGETHDFFLDDDHELPGHQVLAAICSRFGVEVVPREEVGFVLERVVPDGGDSRTAVRAVLAAQDAVFAAHRASLETGEGWTEAVLEAAREHELPFDGA